MIYKRLGDYIQQVNERNRDLEIKTLLGVSITKKLIPSIANTIGTDMSVYKIIKKRQFAYGTVTSRNGEKISIALSDEHDKALVSQIYVVFEVVDKNILLPEYVMMWFSRPEFDRYARYNSHGSTRETFDWSDLCDVELPVPSIEKQKAIVAQYQSISNKIKVNEQICEKLEATAQALYKHWFVDFEFPNEEGQPYKSSGGVMVWNEELDREIPEGWGLKRFTEIVNLTGGGTPRTNVLEYWDGDIPFFTPADVSMKYYSIETIKTITELGLKESSTKLYPKNTIFITARGTVGAISLAGLEMAMNQSCYAIYNEYAFYTHQLILSIIEQLKGEAVGAVFNALVTKDFEQQIVLEPEDKTRINYNETINPVYEKILNIVQENKKLANFQSLLLSRLATLNVEEIHI